MTREPLPPHHPHCLGCGDRNPAGLGMRMERDGDRVRGTVTLDRRHEGAPGYAHGGAVVRRAAEVHLDPRRDGGAPQDEQQHPEGVVEDRGLWMVAELRDEGELIAEARSLFLEVEADHFARGVEASAEADAGLGFPW